MLFTFIHNQIHCNSPLLLESGHSGGLGGFNEYLFICYQGYYMTLVVFFNLIESLSFHEQLRELSHGEE